MATKKKKKRGRAPILVLVLTVILSVLLFLNFRGNNIKLSKDERVLIIGKQNLYAVYEDKLAVKIPFELYIDSEETVEDLVSTRNYEQVLEKINSIVPEKLTRYIVIKSGEIKLDVKSNDYFSVRPEIGTELAYRHYFGANTIKATVGVAYENELGRVANGKNKARVVDTTADWFNIRGEKEDRRGNVKFDLNLGLDNQKYGVTANVGYDTKGENLRGGLGLRVIF